MRDFDLRDPAVRSGDIVVSASAGSGKTFTLSVLVTAELGLGPARPHELLATTFGEAAAADLRERLLRPLDLLNGLSDSDWEPLLNALQREDKEAFTAALDQIALPEGLLKSREEVCQASRLWTPPPPWAGTPAAARAFWRRTRREAELLRVSTIHSLAQSLLRQGEAPQEILDTGHPALLRLLRQALRATLGQPDGDPLQGPARRLLRWAERNWEELSKIHDGHRDALGHLDPPDLSAARDALEGALDAAEAAFRPFQMDFSRAYTPTRQGQPPAHARRSKLKDLPEPGASIAQRLDWAEAQHDALLDSNGHCAAYWSPALAAAHATLQPVADALEALFRDFLVVAFRAFEALKVKRGFATFGDLVRRALEGLEEGRLTPPRPALLLVDEYQDTSRVQDAFLSKLGASRIVRVGDLKQAIYAFRGGDPDILREHLAAAGSRAFRLPQNYRSARPIVELANTYVDRLWPQLDPDARELDGTQAPVKPDCGPVGFLRTEVSGQGKDLPAFSDWIAALSQEAGWAQALGLVPAQGRRTRALLLPQRTGLPALLRALKRQGIRPYVIAREGFWLSPGVRLLMTALEAVARPERPAPAAALLRQFAGLTDGELCTLSKERNGLPGLGRLQPEALPEARQQKGRWLRSLLGLTTQELAGRVLAEGSLLAAVSALDAHGPLEPLRARRNLATFLTLLEASPGDPASAWAELRQVMDGTDKGDVPTEASEADLLIPTVHGSKGLEYDDVILPMLHGKPQSIPYGTAMTDPVDRSLRLGWKLGAAKGRDLVRIGGFLGRRRRRDGLNLLYVALTRAKQRMVILEQGPLAPKSPLESATWAEWGLHLQASHASLCQLGAVPNLEPLQRPPVPELVLSAERQPLASAESRSDADEVSVHGSLEARRNGEAMHAFVRDLLVRWEDPDAFERCLQQAPQVPRARELATRFLAQMEARGWRSGLRRRTELPLEGSGTSGALGRADLVVWGPERIHLVDLKHSEAFDAAELGRYRAQLQRYARVLRQRHPESPVSAWLVALKSGTWIAVEVDP